MEIEIIEDKYQALRNEMINEIEKAFLDNFKVSGVYNGSPLSSLTTAENGNVDVESIIVGVSEDYDGEIEISFDTEYGRVITFDDMYFDDLLYLLELIKDKDFFEGMDK